MRCLFAVVFLVLAATPSRAATWHVAKDGSGDFTVIQDAIDAASHGDTIRIHAGRYEDIVEDWDVYGDGTVIADVHVAITKNDLTLVGDGVGSAIIGPDEYPSSPAVNYIGIVAAEEYASSLELSALSLENMKYGSYITSSRAVVADCAFEGCYEGVRIRSTVSGDVVNCVISNCSRGVVVHPTAQNVTIGGGRFSVSESACIAIGASNVLVDACEVGESVTAFDFQQGSSVRIVDTDISGFSVIGVKVVTGSSAEIDNCRIIGGEIGVKLDGESVHCTSTVLSGQSYRTISVFSSGSSSFTDCDIINGGGLSVYCGNSGSGDCHIDMTNNYWGTDLDLWIEHWIDDSHDDWERCCTVDYVPFKTESTPAEARSLSSVKGLFEVGGDE